MPSANAYIYTPYMFFDPDTSNTMFGYLFHLCFNDLMPDRYLCPPGCLYDFFFLFHSFFWFFYFVEILPCVLLLLFFFFISPIARFFPLEAIVVSIYRFFFFRFVDCYFAVYRGKKGLDLSEAVFPNLRKRKNKGLKNFLRSK